jgi:hypothetical protein
MSTKHTPGPLTVRVDGQLPFRIKTYNEKGEVVFSTEMPCYSAADKCAADAIACRSRNRVDRAQAAAINHRAVANEVVRAAAPELLDALQRTAKHCEAYADWIKRNVMSATIEEHPYLPELEGDAEDALAAIASLQAKLEQSEARRREATNEAWRWFGATQRGEAHKKGQA